MRTPILLFAASLISCSALAQQAPRIPVPTPGPLVTYMHWPTQYVQWVGTELPYTMIELDVDKGGKSPLIYVTLTDRASSKRVHYTNADGLVAYAKSQNEEAYKTEIALESDDTESVGSTMTVRLSLKDGKPLQWRFVQGSDISEQGSGLTPLPAAPIPIFVYREQGAVAGEGTALQIGETVSTAEVWKEISHPPQFVAYRGAVTKDAHTLVLAAGKESWTVASAPAALAAGATWELDSPTGNHRTLRVAKLDGSQVTVTGSDRFQPAVHFTMEASYGAAGWSVSQIRYAPVRGGDKHFAQLQFSPALASSPGDSTMTVGFGSKKPIAEGSVKVEGSDAGRTLSISFATPAWLHGKTLTETITATPDAVGVQAHP